MWWLEYGFNLWKYGKDEFQQKKYEKLSEFDKDLYHRILQVLLAVVRINHVSRRSIPIIIMRHRVAPILKEKDTKKYITEKYLKRFVGFETNVKTETDREFLRRLEWCHLEKSTLKSRIQIEQQFLNYLKEVHDKDKTATASACKEVIYLLEFGD